MKRGAGFLALFAFLLAGAHFASGPKASPSSNNVETLVSPPRQTAREDESCTAFDPWPGKLATTSVEKRPDTEGEVATLVDRYLYGAGQSTHLMPGTLPKGIRLMIASVPDPMHTHLSLQFDRALEAIQQAAQDEKYTYDSSWLPWKSEPAGYSSLADQSAAAADTARRELCPGVILFRKNMGVRPSADDVDCQGNASEPQPANQSYACGMLVFIVAETPTAGLNGIQWKNALQWINEYASRDKADKVLRILGPTFSGSMPSYVRTLNSIHLGESFFDSILLYSGRIRGCASWRWLQSEFGGQRPPSSLPVRISDFEENDAIQTDRFYRYLEDRGHRLAEVAILSEDETAYGGLPDSHPAAADQPGLQPDARPEESQPTPCEPAYPPKDRPVHLYYPRDISAMRSAYQEQSIFSAGTTTDASAPHTVLRPESNRAGHISTDTIEPFSGANLALAEEAQMYALVNILNTHGIRFVILRSTNSLDYLFLTRFLHRAYPVAYIVTMGTDMLFGREIDSTEFRGVIALSAFPLLPRGQDWTKQTDDVPQHAHRAFGSYTMEGDYLATRFLITDPGVTQEETPDQPFEHHFKKDIPDYAPAFWDVAAKNDPTSEPSTWLSVIGRDGYWPLAILKEYSRTASASGSTHLTRSAKPEKAVRFSNLALVEKSPENNPSNSIQELLTLSSAWKFLCALAVLAIGTHFFACRFGWRTQSFGMFVQFTPVADSRGLALIALGWAIISSLLLLLFMASFRIYEWLGSSDRMWVWLTGLAAIAGCAQASFEVASWRIKPVKGDLNHKEMSDPNSSNQRDISFLIWIALMLALIGLTAATAWQIFTYGGDDPDGVTFAFRSVHLTSGVSPVVSLIVMLAGFYWWFLQTLSGLALLGNGRPILPDRAHLPLGFVAISNEIGDSIDSAAVPFPRPQGSNALLYIIPVVLVVLQGCLLQRPWSAAFDLVLHSLENTSFNWTLHILFWIALYILLLECTQLLFTWLSLKRLLMALNRLPLRRTFAALQGLSMRSLWSLSGTSSRARYKVFSHQIESLLHLRNELESSGSCGCGDDFVRLIVSATWVNGWQFVQGRSQEPDLALFNGSDAFAIRAVLSRCTNVVLTHLIIPEWLAERTSLDLDESPAGGDRSEHLPLSDKPPVKLAEEFVCMVYVGYLQNMLACMRTMVLSVAGLFASIALSVAFYPYTPRPTIALSLLLLLLIIGAIVASVYAGLDRDSTLSHITKTEPGSLGVHFWLRIVSFAGVPALGLLAAQFPGITDFLFSWIQPSMNAVK